jgi:hypothetical protein
MSIREALERLFDLPILEHGFAPYMRDYRIVSEIGGKSDQRGRYLHTFTHCSVVNVTTTVRDDSWRVSWDDHFTDYQRWLDAGEPDGYVWGANWSLAYPGPTYVEGSALAREWSGRLGRPMHEAVIETNAIRLQIVFHDLKVERIGDQVSVYDQVTFPLH